MTNEFLKQEKLRLEIAEKIKKLFPQNRRGGYRDIAAEQWDRTGQPSSEPSKEAFELIKQNSSEAEPE